MVDDRAIDLGDRVDAAFKANSYELTLFGAVSGRAMAESRHQFHTLVNRTFYGAYRPFGRTGIPHHGEV